MRLTGVYPITVIRKDDFDCDPRGIHWSIMDCRKVLFHESGWRSFKITEVWNDDERRRIRSETAIRDHKADIKRRKNGDAESGSDNGSAFDDRGNAELRSRRIRCGSHGAF
jgi:hypothetical protein